MSFSSEPHNARNRVASPESLFGCMPMELILNIMDAAVVQHRRDNLCWSLTLSLVCSTVRATVLPIIYEVIFLDIEADRQRDFVGWDGRTHKHAPLAFLSWHNGVPTVFRPDIL